ncbi:hypothetical protein [Sporomusa acidovorans]|uniref:hypothetical protein n=1 Tax=Sporomusa acidovorans TaxID=112900 RepID=UPI0015A32478
MWRLFDAYVPNKRLGMSYTWENVRMAGRDTSRPAIRMFICRLFFQNISRNIHAAANNFIFADDNGQSFR